MFKKTRLRFSDKEYTIGGVLSSALAVISFIVFGYSVSLSFRARGEGSQILAVFGLIFGLFSYKEQDKRYGASFFGTFINGIIVVILVLFILVGL